MDDISEPLAPHQLQTSGSIDHSPDMCQDYRLTTAEIMYHIPDYPDLLQSYLWQSLDRIPDFPKLNRFLSFWEKERDGTLHAVRIGYVGIIQPGEWRFAECMLSAH